MQNALDKILGFESDQKRLLDVVVRCKNRVLDYKTTDYKKQEILRLCDGDLQLQDYYDC